MKFKQTVKVVLKSAVPLGSGLLFLVCLVLVIAWMAGVFERKIEAEQSEVARPKATKEEQENAYRVREVYKDYVEEAVGTLKAAERTEISARVLAPINKIEVRARQMVKKDKVLIRLDPRDLETELSRVEASRVAAEAALERASSDYRRAASLYEKKAISRAELERAVENVKVSQANLKHAQQTVEGAKVRLSYSVITAPKAGMIVDRLAEEGDMARPGEPLLTLYDPDSLRLEVPVMEDLAVNLKPGDKLDVYIDARNRKIKAEIDEIVPQAEAASRSFLVKVWLPRSEDLFEGLFGRLRIPVGKRRHLCLHTGAIETIGQLQFVEVIRPDGFKELRLIKTGRMGYPDHVEVLSGLEKDERVVIRRSKDAAGSSSPNTQTQSENHE